MSAVVHHELCGSAHSGFHQTLQETCQLSFSVSQLFEVIVSVCSVQIHMFRHIVRYCEGESDGVGPQLSCFVHIVNLEVKKAVSCGDCENLFSVLYIVIITSSSMMTTIPVHNRKQFVNQCHL